MLWSLDFQQAQQRNHKPLPISRAIEAEHWYNQRWRNFLKANNDTVKWISSEIGLKKTHFILTISPLLLLIVFASYSFFWFCKLKYLLRKLNERWLISSDLTSLPPTVQNEVKDILSLACDGGQWSKSRKLGQASFKAGIICFSKHNYLFVSNTIQFHT